MPPPPGETNLPNDPHPAVTPPPFTGGTGNPGNVNNDPNVQIGGPIGTPPMDIPLVPPTDYYGWTDNGVPLNFQNELGYNPSYPYGAFGSGVPTRKFFGATGNIIGGGIGSFFGPLGNLGGSIGGGQFGSWLGKLFNNWRMNQGAGGGGGGGTSTSGGGATAPGGGGGGHGFFDRWSASGIPGVGVGINPSGAPARGREWWSNDFGRWNLGESGLGAGGYYNQLGPGGPIGTAGIVNASSPAGGGSYFGGRGNLGMSLPGSFAGLGSFGGASPLSGPWGGINSPVGRAALAGRIIDPGRMPSPDYNWGNTQISAPGNAPIVNWAAFGAPSTANQSVHFRPRALD